ncbi:hypothetical protein LWI29_019721 [Acer saccharum]|uniref:Uncharacterized protein n=1 Tax=Acer saccharum TaxID=4024 RepID=A0AA39RQU1_ACESA|nr:hypothetical protein LWI29_019721 [Acer saccharum]
MKSEDLAMLCSALSIKEREGPIGTLDSKLKAKGEQLFKLGHSLRECSEPGDGEESIIEAQLRLNVWLRSKSPPKRFHHRNAPAGRRYWGNQSGRLNFSTGQGNWRAGESWKKPGDGGPERISGNRSWWKDSQLKRQVGASSNIEPNNSSMGKASPINTASGKLLTVVSSEKSSLADGISINKGNREAKSPAKDTQMMEANRDTGRVKEVEVPFRPNQDNRPTENTLNQFQPQTQDQTMLAHTPVQLTQSKEDPRKKKAQSGHKWKRAARGNLSSQTNSDLGEIQILGKRGKGGCDPPKGEVLSSPATKKAKNSGKVETVAPGSREDQASNTSLNSKLQLVEDGSVGNGAEDQSRVVQPELVTSAEVSSLVEEAPSHFQSAGRSLSARRVQ